MLNVTDEIKKVWSNTAIEVNRKIKNNEIINLSKKDKAIIVDEDIVKEVHKCLGIGVIKGSDNMEAIRIPYLGVFEVYEGRSNVLDEIAALKQIGMSKEEIKESLKVKVKKAVDNGLFKHSRKGFKLM